MMYSAGLLYSHPPSFWASHATSALKSMPSMVAIPVVVSSRVIVAALIHDVVVAWGWWVSLGTVAARALTLGENG